ncbi:MAG: hypothetical protein M1831_002740 [Alyxoria varia]|nr:MAG: hypothetical protein M1831_002740 [Alyxoria varia]
MASSSAPQSPLLYSCIAHNTTILAEHTASPSSNTSSLASVILPKISHDQPQKLTYTHGQHLIHYISDAPSSHPSNPDTTASNLTFLTISPASLPRRIPFNFLAETRQTFLSTYPPSSTDFSSLPPYGAAAFNATLKNLMGRSGVTQGDDALSRARAEIDDARGVMTENIDRVLERGERIDLLVDKTDRLGGSARDFRFRSRGLRRKMWWKNVKLMALLVVVAVFLLYLIVGMGFHALTLLTNLDFAIPEQ